jgi:hypothetical protein
VCNPANLIVIAGPSAVGKSVLMKQLRSGRPTGLSDPLFPAASSYMPVKARKLAKFRCDRARDILLHCDFLHQLLYRAERLSLVAELIGAAGSTSVLTLCAPAELLLRRMKQRVRKAFVARLIWPNKRRTQKLAELREKRALYTSADRIVALYEEWAAFVKACGVARHLIADLSPPEAGPTRPYSSAAVASILAGGRHA